MGDTFDANTIKLLAKAYQKRSSLQKKLQKYA